MKCRQAILFPVIVLLLAAALFLFVFGGRRADTPEEVAALLQEELPQGEILFAGEFVKGEEALLWFHIQQDQSSLYRAVDCDLLRHGYRVGEVLKPSSYTADIVHILWKGEDIWLINNPNCAFVVQENEAGEVLSETDLRFSSQYPHIYQHEIPDGRSSTRFLDWEGNEIS